MQGLMLGTRFHYKAAALQFVLASALKFLWLSKQVEMLDILVSTLANLQLAFRLHLTRV